MDFEVRSLTFEEADYYYVRLKEVQDGCVLRDEKFADLLKRLMVRDGTGRWWAKSNGTGEWHYNVLHRYRPTADCASGLL